MQASKLKYAILKNSFLYLRSQKPLKMLLSLVTTLLIIYFGLGLMLYFLQPRLTFQPSRDVPYNPSDIELQYDDVKLETTDGLTLSAWYIPAENAKFTLLFCHGNGGNMAHRLESINIFNRLGLNCLIFDYRGYGDSNGKPSEKGVYIDTQTAYDWLINKKKFSPENIIIFGRSVGASIAAHLASNVKAKGLIMESSFTSYADIGHKYYPYMPVRLLARYSFSAIDYIKKVHCPILSIHSPDDDIIPFKLGRPLYAAANEPKEFLEISGNHNEGFLDSGQIYYHGLEDWLEFLKNYRHGL